MPPQLVTTVPRAASVQQGAGSRLVNLTVDPASAFRGIADDAPWFLAFVAAVTLRFGSLFIFYRPTVTPLKLVVGVVFQITTVAPLLLLTSAVVWMVAKAWGLRVGWKPIFSITTHVYVAYTLATVAVASIAGALLPESADIDLRNPPFVNLASLVAESAGGIGRRVLGELDIRSAYALMLLWFGLRAASADDTRSRIPRVIASVAGVRLAAIVFVEAMR